MNRYICIHSHFYQPPRENPWLEEIEFQDSAYPYHDWNERITAECYSPNTASRILDSEKRISEIINNYTRMSFNYGPTLLSWMEKYARETYQSILLADIESQKNFSGHGSAIAQAFNHIILPLANDRDIQTQVIWGIEDFKFRFKRMPEGMWLPETAVNYKSLEALAEQGIKFTILAPRQALRFRKIGEKKWKETKDSPINTSMAYVCRLPSGKSINLFFYDGGISQDLAFGNLLDSGENLANRILNSIPDTSPGLAHVATDGETYGHHHRYGEMALSYCLYHIHTKNLAKITIYSEYLELFPPTHEAEIIENSSWSCIHGVGRWKEDCGCNSGGNPGWNQEWREPLKNALDWLRGKAIDVYEQKASALSSKPWDLRDHYISVVLDRSLENVDKFFKDNFEKSLNKEDRITILKLLELQRHSMLMYTSCGWFFDEISGIETTQILRYAARVIQLIKELSGEFVEDEFVALLKKAPSNLPQYGDGSVVYEKNVKPSITDLLRVGAHYAVSSLFEDYSKHTQIYCYTVHNQMYERFEQGKMKLAVGRTPIFSNITHEESTLSFAVLHLGDHNLSCGVGVLTDEKATTKIHQDIKEAFRKNDVSATMKLIEKSYPDGHYSLWHLFKDEQSKILYQILDSTLEEIETSLRQVNEYHYPIIQVIKQLHIPLPKVLANTVLVMLNKDLLDVLGAEVINFKRLEELVSEVKEWSLEIDKVTLGFVVNQKINDIMLKFLENPYEIKHLEILERIFRTLLPLHLSLDLWKAQNIYYSVGKKFYNSIKEKVASGNATAKKWIEYFDKLGEYLRVKVLQQ
jgi:alpha-amylase/alpha-mannosidase (GH57 family)